MKKLTEIFFIAYQFPPLNVGGSFRPLKFVKYFNDFYIRPVIFTLSPDDFSKIYENKKPDYGLLKEIDNVDKEIINVKTDDLLATRKNKVQEFLQIYFNVTKGHEYKKWEKHFFQTTEDALKRYKPKAIVVTAPPFGIIDLAYKLSKKTKIPLIIDMRDSLSMWISQPFGSFLHYKLTLRKERKWFNHAHKIIAVTKQMVNDWKGVHKNISENRLIVIPNGYDEELSFEEIILEQNKPNYTIGYVGSFYYNPESRAQMFTPWQKKHFHRKLQYTPRKEDWLYRSPYFLFKTIRQLFNYKPEYSKKITIKFAGLKPDWLFEMVKEFGLEENVEMIGFVPFYEIGQFHNSCDMLLATSVKVIGGEDYCIAGKSFDYLVAQKPILGFVSNGAQKDFIQKSGVGLICNPDNIEESAEKLKEVFEKGITLKPNKEFIENHHRKHLTKQLADIIHSI